VTSEEHLAAREVKPLSADEFRRNVIDMNARIAARRTAAPNGRPVPISGPRWAERVVDIGDEILAIHRTAAEPYPLDVHADLSIEDHCIVVLRRILAAGGHRDELERVVEAFGLPGYARARLRRYIREVS
jgi:hypothetical protein